jgi:hypothetical protein
MRFDKALAYIYARAKLQAKRWANSRPGAGPKTGKTVQRRGSTETVSFGDLGSLAAFIKQGR